MRIAVAGSGYQSAVRAFVTGNDLAARTAATLADDLAGYAGMAGNDATAADFAATYDEAAGEAVAALGELTFALASLGHLTEQTLHNHAWADTVTAPPTLADRAVGVRPAGPPSSLGADPGSLPHWATVVLDALEGVFWPNADTDRLRSAAARWRAAATSTGLLAAHCSTALAALEEEVSPELPLAMAATADLRARCEALADQLGAIGTACESYADQVDAKRAEILDFLEEIAWELGIGAVVSGVLIAVTGGGATPIAGSAGAARIAAASARVRGILESLGVLTRGTATTLRPIAATARDTRAYLAQVARARRMAMTERGSMDFSACVGRKGDAEAFIRLHDKAGGHIWERHVGLDRVQLEERLARDSKLDLVSTFRTPADAARAIRKLIDLRHSEISAWLAGEGRSLAIQAHLRDATGVTLDRTGTMSEVNGVRAFLIRAPELPDGFRIHTSYPQP